MLGLETWVWGPALSCVSCVALDRRLSLSVPLCDFMVGGNNSTCLTGLLSRLRPSVQKERENA